VRRETGLGHSLRLTIAFLVAIGAAACGGATHDDGDPNVGAHGGGGSGASHSGAGDTGDSIGDGMAGDAGSPAQGGSGSGVRGSFSVLAVGPGGQMCGADAPELNSFDRPSGTIDVHEEAGELTVAFEGIGVPCMDGQSFSATDMGDAVSFLHELEVGPGESPRRLSFYFHPSFREPPPYVGLIDEQVMLEPDPADSPSDPEYQRSGGYHFWLVE
jgi:hypothetical protein